MESSKIEEKAQKVWNAPLTKMVRGIGGVVGGITTATGGGLIGGFLKSHHMMTQAQIIGKKQAEMGAKLFDEGCSNL